MPANGRWDLTRHLKVSRSLSDANFYRTVFNPLNGELNLICHLLELLGAHPILHVSRIRVNIENFLFVTRSLPCNYFLFKLFYCITNTPNAALITYVYNVIPNEVKVEENLHITQEEKNK
jgi:hypothetical protein